jgi:hypothetical protein
MQGSHNGLIARTITACSSVPEGINGIQEEHLDSQNFWTRFKCSTSQASEAQVLNRTYTSHEVQKFGNLETQQSSKPA